MYRLYLGENINNMELMPITPKSFTVSIGSRNEVYDLVNGGQFNVLKEPALSEMSVEILLPNIQYDFAEYPNGFHPANYYMVKFDSYMMKKVPIHLLLLRSENNLDDTSMLVSIEDMEQKEDVTEYGLDLVVTLKLKRYEDKKTQISKVEQVGNGNRQSFYKKPNRPNTRKVPASTKIAKDISMLDFVKKTYGDTKKFDEIMKLNKFTNPSKKLTKGMVIKLVKT